MPQATDTLRRRVAQIVSDDSLDTEPVIKFLQARGYVLLQSWEWRRPTEHHEPTVDELDCLQFLIDEWDFGGYL